jgi:hypothetical protein
MVEGTGLRLQLRAGHGFPFRNAGHVDRTSLKCPALRLTLRTRIPDAGRATPLEEDHTMFIRTARSLCLTLSLAAAFSLPAAAQQADGYLCCNLRSDGNWISDINYAEDGKHLIPAGTPVKVLGQGRYRVYVQIEGRKQALGNDYSRDLDLNAFTARYVVKIDPTAALAETPAKIRDAIASARLTPGMTREQVFMSVGYPVTRENPHLDAPLLRFWLNSFAEFQVKFDERGLVQDVAADQTTRNLVMQP